MMGHNRPRIHVVAIPHVTQGHLIPFLQLSNLLASQGLIVSFLTTSWNVTALRPQVDKLLNASNNDVGIRLVSLTVEAPPEIESSEKIPIHMVEGLMAGPLEEWLDRQINAADKNIDSDPPPPICIISDIFMGWAYQIGAKFGVPTVTFHTNGAFAVSVMHSCLTYEPQKNVEGEEYFQVPNLCFDLKLRKSELPVMMLDPEKRSVHDLIKRNMNTSMEGRGVIFNTFYEMEAMGIDNIKTLTGRPVWSIGPLLPATVFDAAGIDRAAGSGRGKAADISEAECVQWLDRWNPNSLVFVCFGSLACLNAEQIGALATGLESSQQPFVWAINNSQPTVIEGGLPEGFEERTKDRGLVIWGWAPQLLILSHPSVGAFLSHCGWNSTLESVSLGVPMIAWPMAAEQPFNSKLLVEQLGIAEKLCFGKDIVPDPENVKRAVIKLLAEGEGNKMRMRAQELKKKAKMAVETNGSSRESMHAFVEYLRGL